MGDTRRQLSELADRVDAAVADGSLASERAVQLRAAEPLVDALGWDVRGEDVRPEVSFDDRTVDYLLEIEGRAAIAVVTASPDTDLEEVVDTSLRPLLEAAHVPQGIATDGRRIALLVRRDEAVYDHAFPFTDLPDNPDALGRFHRSSLEERLTDPEAERREAARRLATERASLETELTETVLDVTGPEVADTVSAVVPRLVDDLIEGVAPTDADAADAEREVITEESARTDRSAPDAIDPEVPTPSSGTDTTNDAESATRAGHNESAGSSADSVGVERSDDETTDDNAPDDAGSYVARFFGGSSSVGAVGTGSPRSTTVGVVRYLLENQQLHRTVTFPWEVETGEPVVSDSPPNPEWIALEHPDVTNVYVRPIDDARAAKAAIEGLAEAVGLRVMFQGDW